MGLATSIQYGLQLKPTSEHNSNSIEDCSVLEWINEAGKFLTSHTGYATKRLSKPLVLVLVTLDESE